jgi:dienelactone hydrolase
VTARAFSRSLAAGLCWIATLSAAEPPLPANLQPHFSPPAEFASDLGTYRSPLRFADGREVRTPAEWQERRREILATWTAAMGEWPPLLEAPELEVLRTEKRENFIQHRVKVPMAQGLSGEGWLLIPPGEGPFPAVLVPFYEPETSIGLKGERRDFALQLTRRGFVTLSIGSPGGDARLPELVGAKCQPLSFLASIAANCERALARRAEVDPARIGIVGHSYGGKWALFASALHERFAAAAWSDPGAVWDEARPNVNYWDEWYLGLEPGRKRPRGPTPRTGAYKALFETGRDLTDLHSLLAPRPFLVSGGSEDPPERWQALNHAIAVNRLLGFKHRVGMTNRLTHDPTDESNAAILAFFDHFLAGER